VGTQVIAPVEGEQADAVILSEDAQSIALLFADAQQAIGIDQKAVERVKQKLASGSYNVSAHDLANAIVTVLKEISE
jgi:anti-sigma28 factor (negative regulator of flagellin synthesis)